MYVLKEAHFHTIEPYIYMYCVCVCVHVYGSAPFEVLQKRPISKQKSRIHMYILYMCMCTCMWVFPIFECCAYCKILRHTAPCCNTLQLTATNEDVCGYCADGSPHSSGTATHCSTLQHTATHCNKLQHSATHRNTLQHAATRCNTLQHTATNVVVCGYHADGSPPFSGAVPTATHCNTLQCTAMQHTATQCNTL